MILTEEDYMILKHSGMGCYVNSIKEYQEKAKKWDDFASKELHEISMQEHLTVERLKTIMTSEIKALKNYGKNGIMFAEALDKIYQKIMGKKK